MLGWYSRPGLSGQRAGLQWERNPSHVLGSGYGLAQLSGAFPAQGLFAASQHWSWQKKGALKYPAGLGNVSFGVGWLRPGDGYADGGLGPSSPAILHSYPVIFFVFSACVPLCVCAINPGFCLI